MIVKLKAILRADADGGAVFREGQPRRFDLAKGWAVSITFFSRSLATCV
jgi:hypothetical protein